MSDGPYALLYTIVMPAALLGLAAWLSGCGASAVQTSARAATVAAVATQGAARVVRSASAADVDATCPRAQYPVRDAALEACAAPVRQRWAPVDAAVASVRAALVAWMEATELAHVAGDDTSLWAPLALAAARLAAEYAALRDVLAAMDVDLPALPAVVTTLAESVGGGQ